MATEVGGFSADANVGTFGGVAFQPDQFTSPDADEQGVPADEGAMGGVAPEVPTSGPIHMPNAAQPGN